MPRFNDVQQILSDLLHHHRSISQINRIHVTNPSNEIQPLSLEYATELLIGKRAAPLGSQTLLQAEIHLSHRPGRILDLWNGFKLEHVGTSLKIASIGTLTLSDIGTLMRVAQFAKKHPRNRHSTGKISALEQCLHQLMTAEHSVKLAANLWYHDV